MVFSTAWFTMAKGYFLLCKPKIVVLIAFTALVGMLLSTEQVMPPLDKVFFGLCGISIAAASAAVINHVVDERVDAIMLRTQNRPLPQGSIRSKQALFFAAMLALLSMFILLQWVNIITTMLTFASLVGYGIVYSLYLKRATPQNIVVGGVPGAAPPVLGWSAITNSIDHHALLLFLIIFLWTPPHFWALAIHRRTDYAKVNIPMLPVTHGVEFTKLHMLLYTFLLVLVSLLPYLFYMSGIIYLMGAILLGGYYIFLALRMKQDKENKYAMPMFGYSIYYLFILFFAMLIDHYFIVSQSSFLLG